MDAGGKNHRHRMTGRREADDQHAPWIAFPVSRDLLGCWRYSKDRSLISIYYLSSTPTARCGSLIYSGGGPGLTTN